jgi:hypothetical protein
MEELDLADGAHADQGDRDFSEPFMVEADSDIDGALVIAVGHEHSHGVEGVDLVGHWGVLPAGRAGGSAGIVPGATAYKVPSAILPGAAGFCALLRC